MKKPKLIVICGPTATGKSALAVKIALKIKGEIISADSRQVYSGLDIGSGKVPRDVAKLRIKNYELRTEKSTRSRIKTKDFLHAGIPHHLLDIANPKKQFSVAQFQKLGLQAIADILKRGKVPIIVGGTGLYIDALIYGTQFPQVPPNKKLRLQLEKMSAEKLYKMLMNLDSVRARTIDKYNPVRLIRAIEIAKTLGKVPKLEKKSLYDITWVGLTLPEEKLKFNIKKRLASRMKEGMVSEVKKLHENGLSWKRLYELGLEYRFISLYLKKELTKSEMLAQLETAIYQYSRRQMTWFKTNKDILWIDASNKKYDQSVNNLINKFIIL